ncbi:MAG: hypothetical protein RTU30_03480 [Candidatus Thorarchaeota archaeon]
MSVDPVRERVDYHSLFLSFLRDTGFREDYITSARISTMFNHYLFLEHPEVKKVGNRKMASILKKWGARSVSAPMKKTRWYVGSDEVCFECCGHIGDLGFCLVCKSRKTKTAIAPQKREQASRKPQDNDTTSLLGYL